MADRSAPATPRRTAGLVDLQVNGFAGIDFNDDTLSAEAMDHALSAMLATGVTTCLPTLITASKDALRRRLLALDAAVCQSTLGPLMVPGYHLEGPFLNPAPGYAGCHPPEDMIAPSVAVMRDLGRDLARPVLYLTIAPELDGAGDVIAWAAEAGKVVGVGHSGPSRDELTAAIAHGLRISTHLGNGVPQILPRSDNPVLRQLARDELFASFIADGLHIPPDTLKVFIRAKTAERAILVTDAVAAAAATPGCYHLGTLVVNRDDTGMVRAANESFLAGSSLTLDRAMANVMQWGLVDFDTALRMASVNPMALLEPALNAHGITSNPSEIVWDNENRPARVSVGTATWRRE